MTKFTFTVDPSSFAVSAFKEDQEAAFIYQPDQPSGQAWESSKQATEWVENLIVELEQSSTLPEGEEPLPITE